MFEAIKLRFFFAKIQAELKAQHNDQAFVNRLCHDPTIVKLIVGWRSDAYFEGTKIAPFLYTMLLLGAVANSKIFTEDDRNLAASLLADRILKTRSNARFHKAHLPVIQKSEADLVAWETSRGSHFSDIQESSDDDFIRGSGRYELRYNIEIVQKIRGKELISEEASGLRSDDLNGLKSMALMHKMAGQKVELRDLKAGVRIAIE